MKINKLMNAIAPLLLAAPFMVNAQMASEAYEGGQKIDLRGTNTVLYDQTDETALGNGAPDQNFEESYDTYDSFVADDFVVDGNGWIINQVDTIGTTTGDADSVTIAFHDDDMGAPNAISIPACTYTDIPITAQNAGSLTVALPTGCELMAGTYWMSIQVNQNFAASGQHFFSNTATINGSEGHWQNPGEGFGFGCATWTASSICTVGGGGVQDYLFSLSGEVSNNNDIIFSNGFEAPPIQ